MGHTASPSLISLGLTADVSPEGSSFRWEFIASCFLHTIVLFMAFSLQFHSKVEAPFRAIDVALISLPPQPQTVPRKDVVNPIPTPKQVRPSQPIPPSPPQQKSQPVEDPLPPLPTETASERLSESFGGAINSIVVPQKRQLMTPPMPTQKMEVAPPKNRSPLYEKLQMPSAPPKISRPTPLQASKPVKILPTPPPPLSRPQTKLTPVETKPQPTQSPTPVAKMEPVMKPAPTLPSLSEVTPFKKRKQEVKHPKASPPRNIEESLKRAIPTVPTPAPVRNIQRKSITRTPPKVPQSSVPEVSAPQLSAIPPLTERPPITEMPRSESQSPLKSQPSKMSDTVKQLMEGLKSKTRKPARRPVAPQKTLLPPTIPSQPVPSELDQRIAKLSIPQVAPVESIKQHLQLLAMQPTSSSGNSVSGPSPGESRYLAMVEDAIDRRWVAPPLLLNNPLVVLKFQIFRTGEISQIHMNQSSGNRYYDAAAKRAIHAVNPLPPFPEDLKRASLDVLYRFIKD